MSVEYTGINAGFNTRFEYFMDRMQNVSISGESSIYRDNFEEILRKLLSRAEADPRNLIPIEQYVDEQIKRYAKFDAIGKGTKGRFDALQYAKKALEHSRMTMLDRVSALLR